MVPAILAYNPIRFVVFAQHNSTEMVRAVKKLIPRIVLPLLLLVCAPCVFGQDDDRPEFKMPCSEVLKLSLDKFTDVYGEKTQDYSTYGMKQAYAYYVDCKRPANDAKARRLGEAKRKQVDMVRDELSKIGNAAWDMTYIAAGGGTMYGLMSVAAYGAREEFIATLITALANDRRQPAARRRANASLAKAKKLIADWSRMPKIEVYGDDSLADKQKIYRDSLKELKGAAARLQTMIRDLPDAAAQRAAAHLVSELDTEPDE
jgi:hypothetical protein